jgi:O-antigen ligase
VQLTALYAGTALASAVAGAIIATHDTATSLKAIVGIPVIIAWIRYPFFLLASWVLIDPFIGSKTALLNGNNFVSALTIPVMLLAASLPLTRTFRAVPALGLFLAFLLWVLLGINVSPLDHGTFLKQWLIMIDFVAVAILSINFISTRDKLYRFIDIILIPPVIIALYGIYGYFTHQNVLHTGIGPARITSVFSDAPTLALLLSNVVPLALFRTFTSRGVRRVLVLTALAILLAGVALTFTRGAIISVAICLVVIVALLPSIRLRIAMLGLFALAVATASLTRLDVLQRFNSLDTATLNGRTYLWHALLVNFNPGQIIGYGLHSSDTLLAGLHIGTNGQLGNGLIATSASNVYIATLYEQGLVGVTLLVLTLLVLAVGLVSGMRAAKGDQRLLFVAALLTLINVLIQSIDLNDVLAQSVGIDFWIIVTLPFAVCWSRLGPRDGEESRADG